MKPRFHKSSRSVLFCAALLSPIVYHSTARAQSGTWNNPALASTGTLTSNITPGTEADLVWTGNPLAFGDLIQLTGTVPGGFTASTYYFVVSSLGDVIQLSATPGGLAILATTAINNGTAVAANKPWQSPASWVGGTIADGFNGVATFGGFDFIAPEVVGVGAFTTIGTLNFTDSTAPAFGLVLTSGTLFFDATLTPQINVTQPASGGAPLQFSGNGPGQSALTIISGIAGLVVNVAGSTTPSIFGGGVDWSSFQGPLTLASGNYQTTAANALPAGGFNSLSLGAGVQLRALSEAANNQIVSGLSGSGTLGTNDNASATGTLTLGTGTSASDSFAYSGVLGGDILTPGQPNSKFNLTKTGGATQELSGDNLYSGTTTINGGVLKMGHVNALGTITGNTTIASGGTLDLNGLTVFEPIFTAGGGGSTATITNSSASPASIPASISNGGNAMIVTGTGTISLDTVTGGGGLGITKNGSNTLIMGGTTDNAFMNITVNDGLVLLDKSGIGHVANGININGGIVRYGSNVVSLLNGTGQINGVIINGGTLDLNGNPDVANTTVGNLSGTGGVVTSSIVGPVTLTIGGNNGNGGNFAGLIGNGSGTLALIKTGTGTITLGGANTYTRGTTVTGGTLVINGNQSSANGAGLVSAGTTLGGSGTVGGSTVINGTLSPAVESIGTIAFANDLSLSGGSSLTYQFSNWNGVAGSGFDTFTAASVAILADAVTKLTLNIDGSGITGFSEANKSFIIASTTGGVTGLAVDNYQVNVSGIPALGTWALAVQGNNLVLNYTASAVAAGNRTWDGGSLLDSNWSTVDNWGTSVPDNFDSLIFDGTTRLSNTNDLVGKQFNAVTFAATAGAFSLAGNEIKLGDASSFPFAITNNSASTQTISLDVLLQNPSAVLSTQNTINAASGELIFNGKLYAAATRTIAKTGSGQLTLGGNADNAFLSLNPQQGNVLLAKASSPTVHALQFLNLPAAYTRTFTVTGTGDDQISDFAQSTIDGGVLDLNGRNETLFNLRSTASNATAGQAVIKNNAVGVNSILTLNSGGNTSFGNKIEASAVVGAGSLSVLKTGGAEIQFNGINTYTGGTTLAGGSIRMSGGPSNTRLGAGTLVLANTTNTALNPGAWPKGFYATVGNFTVNNNIIVQAGTFNRSEVSASGTHTYSGTLTGSGTLSIAAGFDPTFAFTGDFTGFTGNLILSGNGGTGGYNGNYDLRNSTAIGLPQGTLTINSGHHSTNVANNARLRWNPTTSAAAVTIPLGGLAGSFAGTQTQANVLITNEKAATVATWQIGALGGTTSYAGVIQNGLGTSALEKVGSGKLTLAGTNTYTGTTTVTAGTLSITGSLATGSAVTVAAAGTLGGTGTVNGTVTASGTIAPGTTVGTLTTGAATLSGTLAVEVNASTADLWAVNGAVNLTSASLSVAEVAAVPIGAVRTIATYTAGGRTGTLTNLSPNYTVTYDQGAGSNEIRITKVADSGYTTWAVSSGLTSGVNDGGGQDPDFDGIPNLMEYILGSTNPISQSSTGILPKVSTNATHLILDFKRKDGSINDTTQVIQISTGLGVWSDFVTLGAASAGPVEITDDGPLEDVRVSIPLSNSENGKLFARLRAIKP